MSTGPTRDQVAASLRAAGCVFAEEEAELILAAARTPGELAAMVEERSSGVPVEQVVGWAEFYGLRIAVASGVFVPRRRTELLARCALAAARRAGPRPVVVDLCCGSGAVGAAVAAGCGDVELYAADVDPAAVACAHRNLHEIGEVLQGDLFEPLPVTLRGRVDVLAANVPYVPSREVALLPAEARLHEPRHALDGGPDGLDVLVRLVAEAPDWLSPDGAVLVEVCEHQAPRALAVCAASGLTCEVAADDDLAATVLVARR